MYEEYKEKYPHWFDKEDNYVQGSKENQIERIKDKILDADNEMMLFGKTEIDTEKLKLELMELNGATKEEINQYKEAAYSESVRNKVQSMVFAAGVQEKINTLDLTPKESLAVKDLYPEWKVGIDVKVGKKYRLGEDLWQVVQAHKTQENWKPSLATASLWKRIDEEHEGSESDPIPYEPPMQIYLGKYYTQGGVKYKCTRDSGIPLSHNLADLVGHYVQKV